MVQLMLQWSMIDYLIEREELNEEDLDFIVSQIEREAGKEVEIDSVKQQAYHQNSKFIDFKILKGEEKKRVKLNDLNSPANQSVTVKSSVKKSKHPHITEIHPQTEVTLEEIRENDLEIERAIRDNVEKMLDQKIEDRLDIITEKIIKDRQSRH